MRIGHFMRGIWAPGGVATYIRRVSRGQASRGHTVVFFDELTAEGNAEVIRVRNARDLLRQADALRLDVLHLHTALGGISEASVPLLRTVHGHAPCCPSGTRHLARRGTPCPRTYHPLGCLLGRLVDRCGSLRPSRILQESAVTSLERRTLPGMWTVSGSHFMAREMIRSGYPPDRLRVLTLPAAPEAEYLPAADAAPPRFVFLGRIEPQKGLDWLLRALRAAPEAVHLDVAGAGYEQPRAVRLAERLGLAHRVKFHGWVSQQEVEALVAASRGVVFPSIWHEPSGLAILDAAARGRPVIASRVGGVPEYAIDGQNAILVEPSDVGGLAEAMSRVARDAVLAQRLGEAGRRVAVERFGLDAHLTALEELYGMAGRTP